MALFTGWNQFKKILLVRPDNMGDLVMTTPAFRALKQTFPEAHLTLLTSTVGGVVAAGLPEIDETIIFDVPWVKNGSADAAQLDDDTNGVTALVEQLKREKFDAAILFTVYSQNPLPAAMICYLAGIPQVLGYCRENPYRLMNCWLPDTEPLQGVQHEVERQLSLVASIGAKTDDKHLRLPVKMDSLAQAKEILSSTIDSDKKWLILHAGVSEQKRKFPPEHYAKAMRQLVKQGWQIVLTGSESEMQDVADLAAQIGDGAFNLAGKLNLDQLIAAISLAPIVVSNNTGPVHLAAATGTPVVVLYAMTNPQHTPWMVPSRVLYFEVTPELRSRNQLLQTFPGPSEPRASAAALAEAVTELYDQTKTNYQDRIRPVVS